MSTCQLSDQQINTLRRLGLGLHPDGSLFLADAATVQTCSMYDTLQPIAAIGWTRMAPAIASERLRKVPFSSIVTKRPEMDCREAEMFAAVCGNSLAGPFYGEDQAFYAHLCDVLTRYGLNDFFRSNPDAGTGLWSIRPRGLDCGSDPETFDIERKNFGRAYRDLPESRKMIVATLIWLYGGKSADSHWMRGLSRRWGAVEAIEMLIADNMLSDWGSLVTRYAGW